MLSIEEINKLVEKAAELKNEANGNNASFEVYLKAQKLYLEAYSNCLQSTLIDSLQRDFLTTIYLYEGLDCEFAYLLKKKEFEQCVNLGKRQKSIIDKILKQYPKKEIVDSTILGWYNSLENHRISADLKATFPIGKSYFELDDYKKALFYFRRAEEILKQIKQTYLNEQFLINYNLNYFILKFNISQCQIGILRDGIDNKEFLERQIIRELLSSAEFSKEAINISNDEIYSKGYAQINDFIKSELANSTNEWQVLYNYTHSHHLLNLMFEVDKDKAEKIIRFETNQMPKKIDYFLFYTHGFNTRGEWKNDLTEIVSSGQRDTNINFILLPWDYGNFKTKFFRSKARQKVIERFVVRYNEILDTFGDCEKKCLIAHSFGTYITGTAIQQNQNFVCDKIIFAGNILDVNYDWNKLKTNRQIDKVLIEQSANDMAVLGAKLLRKVCFQKWIGYAGRDGFKGEHDFITPIRSKSGHSGMLSKENMSNIWFNFLIS